MLLAASLADNGGATKTLSLGATSVAVNAGYITGMPSVDQRNFARGGGKPDIGAYDTQIVDPSTGVNKIRLTNPVYVYNHRIISNVEANLQIISVSGKTIKSLKVTSGQEIVLPSGAYIIHIDNEKSNYVGKVVL